MNQKRYNFKCEAREFEEFIKKLNGSGKFTYRNHAPAGKNVMQSRYTYTCEGCRVSVVYETKAKTLIFTAPENIMQLLVDIYNSRTSPKQTTSALIKTSDLPDVTQKKEVVADNSISPLGAVLAKDSSNNQPNDKHTKQNAKSQKTVRTKANGANNAEKTTETKQNHKKKVDNAIKTDENSDAIIGFGTKKTTAKQRNVAVSKGNDKQQAEKSAQPIDSQALSMGADGKKRKEKSAKSKRQNVKKPLPKQNAVLPESAKEQADAVAKSTQPKNEKTFTIKKFERQRSENVLTAIKESKKMRLRQAFTDSEVAIYFITDGASKVSLRIEEEKIMLSGVKCRLFDEVQLIISQACDYKTAISTHIKLAGEEKRAFEIERQLRKKLPDAYEFLGEQARIDFAIGIIDIDNSTAVLYDYSTLLIPCFRGLERLIFDLQRAQNIEVKMIGQAYEKEGGNYVLKSGYRRKIPSVVYAEVMAALYTAYNNQRNFYAHSDGLDEKSRIITDRNQVREIFDGLLNVINYNGKKLKEIGFSV